MDVGADAAVSANAVTDVEALLVFVLPVVVLGGGEAGGSSVFSPFLGSLDESAREVKGVTDKSKEVVVGKNEEIRVYWILAVSAALLGQNNSLRWDR